MTRRKSSTPAGQMIDRFSYTPGDGYRYAWRGTVIVVERIIQPKPGTVVIGVSTGAPTTTGTSGMSFQPTGDVIPCPEIHTATAFMDTVDRWRAARTVGAGS